MCNECWDGGELIVCDMCPMAFHLQCIGLHAMPKSNFWFCPHHECATCHRRVSAAALLFRWVQFTVWVDVHMTQFRCNNRVCSFL